jgi:ABC-type transporter Mla subunit MlaD
MTAKRTVAADAHPAAEERPADEAELRQEIERTREQLGETVEQLAATTDVQARARAKAAELTGQAKSTTAHARTRAAAQFGNVRGQLKARAATVREAPPESLRRAVAKGASTAQQRRVPLAMAAVALIAGYLVLRWWRKR